MPDVSDHEFELWMKEIDSHVLEITGGVSVDDLPDFGFRDAFRDGRPALEVAKEVLQEAGW